jgi:hypothetical protein
MEGKSEIEWKKKGGNRFRTKITLYLYFKLRDFEGPIPHEKVPLFLDMNLLVNRMDNPTLNFTQKRLCFRSIEWYQVGCVFLDYLPTFGAFQLVAFLELCVVDMDK